MSAKGRQIACFVVCGNVAVSDASPTVLCHVPYERLLMRGIAYGAAANVTFMHVKRLVFAACTAVLLGVSAPASAAYPERPIRLIVPFPAGSANDLVARAVNERLAKRIGKPVVIENRPGAAGATAMQAFVDSATPDGYQIILGSVSIGTHFAIRKKPEMDPRSDLTPLVMVSNSPMTINIPSSLAATNLGAFIDYLKANPGKANYATIGGNGGAVHLYTLLFMKATGTRVTHVPYPGSPQAVPALMDNQVQLLIVDNGSIVGSAQTGKIRVLAAASPTRIPTFPDAPTTTEAGLQGFHAAAWYGLFGPRKLAPDVRATLQKHLLDILADEGFKSDMERRGAQPGVLSGEAFGQFLSKEIDGWKAIVSEAGLELQ